MSVDLSPTDAKTESHPNSTWRATIGFLIFWGVLNLITVLTPARVKLFFLFPILLGGVVGWGISRFFPHLNRRTLLVWGCVLGSCTWGIQLASQYQTYVAHWKQALARDPSLQWFPPQADAAVPSNVPPEGDRAYQEHQRMIQARHREVQSLESFLRTRFAPIGISSTFGRWSLTVVEVLLCGLGSAVAVQFLGGNRKEHAQTEGGPMISRDEN